MNYIYYNYTDDELFKIKDDKQINCIYYSKQLFNMLKYDEQAKFSEYDYDFSFNSSSKVNTYLTGYNLDILCDKLCFASLFSNKKYCPLTITKNNLWYYRIFKNKINNKNFFVKPQNGSCGYNIIITNDPITRISKNDKLIAQEEIITKPIKNRKWDIRIYVVHQIINEKLHTFVYKDGIIRLAPEIIELDNIRSKITNTSSLGYKDDPEELNFSFKKHSNYDIFFSKIINVIKDIHKFISNDMIYKKIYCLSEFQLMGYDFIISENNQVFLLEINACPHAILEKNSYLVKNLKYELYENINKKFIKAHLFFYKKYDYITNEVYIMNDNFIEV